MRELDRLIERLGARAAGLPARDELERAVTALVARAEARLPHHPVPRIVLVDRIADALAAGDDAIDASAIDALAAEDLYLACALARGDDRAVAVAEAELVPVIRTAVGKVDSSPAFVDEITQHVRARLLVGDGDRPPTITSYRGTGPLGAWVRVIATRAALDVKRKASSQSDDVEALDRIPAPDDPELALMWQQCAAEYKRALGEAFAALSRRDRTLVKRRYLDGLELKPLGRLYRVNASTVLRWLQQIEQQLAAATRQACMSALRMTESQVESVERMVASQLELSLRRILRGGASK